MYRLACLLKLALACRLDFRQREALHVWTQLVLVAYIVSCIKSMTRGPVSTQLQSYKSMHITVRIHCLLHWGAISHAARPKNGVNR